MACDGSCLKNPGGATGWAWAAEDGRWASGYQPVGTNQVAELWGLLSVLRDFPDVPLLIQLDSEYARKVAVTWAPRWALSGWRTAGKQPVKNLALVQAIHRRMTVREQPVRMVHVPGHDRANRWPLNTLADKYAATAAQHARQHHVSGEFSGTGPAVLHAHGPQERDLRQAAGPHRRRAAAPARARTEFCLSCDGLIDPNGDCRCSA